MELTRKFNLNEIEHLVKVILLLFPSRNMTERLLKRRKILKTSKFNTFALFGLCLRKGNFIFTTTPYCQFFLLSFQIVR